VECRYTPGMGLAAPSKDPLPYLVTKKGLELE
jgi:hypothetical protein